MHRRLFIQVFGGNVYAVGGSVRDQILGFVQPEIDLLVANHSLKQVISKLRRHGRVDLVGKSFGIIKFTADGVTYDIALPRKDIPLTSASRSHKDFIIQADPWLPVEKDLERRDFTINSMAIRLKDGRLIDPFGGLKDIKTRRIKLTNPQAFPDDPLRVLRAARFASVLDFKIDPSVYDLARKVNLLALSSERVNEELFKILLHSKRPSKGLEELFTLGALDQLFPELAALTLVIQDSYFHPEKDHLGHHTVWAHTKLTVDQASAITRIMDFSQEKKLALLLAALYHDAGKASTTQWNFKKGRMVITSNGHDLESEKIVRKRLEQQRIYSWNGYDLAVIIPLLIRTHHRASELWQNRRIVTRKAFNRLAVEVRGEIELVIALDAADRFGRKIRLIKSLDREAVWLLGKFNQLKVNKETIKPLVMGRDLIGLGVKPGPEMGKLLKKLYEMQLDGLFLTRAEGIRTAEKILKEKKS